MASGQTLPARTFKSSNKMKYIHVVNHFRSPCLRQPLDSAASWFVWFGTASGNVRIIFGSVIRQIMYSVCVSMC